MAAVATAVVSSTRPSTLSVERACRLVMVYRDAELGPETVVAGRDALRRVVHGLPADGTSQQLAIRRYADAALGPPTAGPARYLDSADRACRRVGVPLFAR